MNTGFDFIGRMKIWFLISGLTIVLGLIAGVINMADPNVNYGHHYPLRLGIDFTGGTVFKLVYDIDLADVSDPHTMVTSIDDIVIGMSKTTPLVQIGKNNAGKLVIQVRTDTTVKDKETELKDAILGVVQQSKQGAKLTDQSVDFVGPVIGKELAFRGILGLVIGGLLITLYVTLRMSLDFAVCAIIALFHDCLVMATAFSIFRLEVDSSFVAALLTVVGYSINDTIVIFDRIRENSGLKKGMPFPDMVNLSLVQTLARSVNTVATTLFPLIALVAMGGPTIRVFCIALLVGITSGAYSSIFNASQLLVWWRRRKAVQILAAKELAFGGAGGGSYVRPKSVKASNGDGGFQGIPSVGQSSDDAAGGTSYGPGKSTIKKKKRKR